jgi:hypothetical protein
VWVLYARQRGSAEPLFESLDQGTRIKVTLDGHTDEIRMDPEANVRVIQDGQETVL